MYCTAKSVWGREPSSALVRFDAMGKTIYSASYFMVRCRMSSYQIVISSKGQVIIPADLRDRLGLEKGTRATWSEHNGRLVLTPITSRRIREVRGSLKPRPGEPSMFDELMAERAREREREKK